MRRKRWFLLFSILLIGGGLGYVLWGGLEKNLVYFVTPSELMAKGKSAIGNPVRLGGVVVPGTIESHENVLTFQLKDTARRVTVVTTKTPPQMFRDEMGVVVEGALREDGKFNADRLMVKHGNEYRPPKEGEMPQEIYRELKQP